MKHDICLIGKNVKTGKSLVLTRYTSFKTAKECWQKYVIPAAKKHFGEITYIIKDKAQGKVLCRI